MASVADSDVIAVLLYLSGRATFASDVARLHRAVLRAQEFTPILRRFGFAKSGLHPISRSLDEALGSLSRSRLIRMGNTDYDHFLMDEDSRRFVASVLVDRISDADRRSLQAAADYVGAVCSYPVAKARVYS